MVTRYPPKAASKIPATNCHLSDFKPEIVGCIEMATTALTIGAPAKTRDITTLGVPFAPKAINTKNAPNAPTTPAINENVIPLPVNSKDELLMYIIINGAIIPIIK